MDVGGLFGSVYIKKGNEKMNYDYEEQETGREENQTADGNKKGGMTVLVVEPLKPAYLKTISGDLKSLQKEVGGLIDATYPFEDRVAVVLNDRGKLDNLMPNRGLYDNDGNLYAIVAGRFLVVGLGEESFCSLNEEMATKYLEKYKAPEMAVCINGKLGMLPIPEEWTRGRDSVSKEPKNGRSQEKKIRKRSRADEGR
jgi:hypothetical protein